MTNELFITREFNAPKSLVFEAFTRAEHLQHWWGPVGLKLEIIQLDVKPGGIFHYKMIPPSGEPMYGVFHYREIESPDKLVFTSSFADADANIISVPFDPNFPKQILNTYQFSEENGKTILKMHGVPFTEVPIEIETFHGLHSSMRSGFGKTFDQLDAYLQAKFQIQSSLNKRAVRTSTYLNFPGTTEEAFAFYKQVFRTEYNGGITRFGEAPPHEGLPEMDEATKKLILHVELPITGGHVLMATDAPESMGFKLIQGNNMHINVEPETRLEATRIFNELAKGGTITMPLQDMFWSAYYGSLTDQYGINWMINFQNETA